LSLRRISCFPAISAEVEAAQTIKDREILVIVGNPPYSGHSKNKGAWIAAKIDAYKQVDGKPLGEKNPKWLQDDYVKFIRFAQMKMDAGRYHQSYHSCFGACASRSCGVSSRFMCSICMATKKERAFAGRLRRPECF
jgi:hypothetical protein